MLPARLPAGFLHRVSGLTGAADAFGVLFDLQVDLDLLDSGADRIVPGDPGGPPGGFGLVIQADLLAGQRNTGP